MEIRNGGLEVRVIAYFFTRQLKDLYIFKGGYILNGYISM